MKKEPAAVTNNNREAYVSKYISFLTNRSISPQFSAFLKGFRTCISKKSLSILSPATLRSVIEGTHSNNLEPINWFSITTYEGGYSADHPVIRAFWRVVSSFSDTQRVQLLEFVTSNNRLPVNGWEGVEFVILRNGGGEDGDADDRLPTAVTCYNRLLLPWYSEEEVLRERLEYAIGNARGFGMA